MNTLVKEELRKCRVANLPEYDDSTTEIIIPKGGKVAVSPYQAGKCYVIELADHILNPNDDSMLSSNWNKGTVPPGKYMKVEISEVMGKMVRINGYTYDPIFNQDLFQMWQGWIPNQGIKIISEL